MRHCIKGNLDWRHRLTWNLDCNTSCQPSRIFPCPYHNLLMKIKKSLLQIYKAFKSPTYAAGLLNFFFVLYDEIYYPTLFFLFDLSSAYLAEIQLENVADIMCIEFWKLNQILSVFKSLTKLFNSWFGSIHTIDALKKRVAQLSCNSKCKCKFKIQTKPSSITFSWEPFFYLKKKCVHT